MSLSRARRSGIQSTTTPKKSRSLLDSAGLPSPVQNLSASVISATQINLTWNAPLFSGDTSITSYVVRSADGVTPSAGTVNISGTSASVTGLTAGTSYSFSVRAQNSIGLSSVGSPISATTPSFNDASGGTITTVSNYNGTGQTWRVHTFNSSGTFTVLSNNDPFNVFAVGGGGGGGGGTTGVNFGPGAASGVVRQGSYSLNNQAYTVTVGSAGSGSRTNGSSGGTSSLGSVVSATGGGGSNRGQTGAANADFVGGSFATPHSGGGAGAAGNGGGGSVGGPGGRGGNPVSSNISGSSISYGGGGGGGSNGPGGASSGGNGGWTNQPGTSGVANRGGGGGGGDEGSANGGNGGTGVVVIAYRIA
jgi:hypothetical protein